MMFSAGSVVLFTYPAVNQIQVSTRLVPRRLVIRSVRDCEKSPLHPATYRLNPKLRRGRFLACGVDLDRQRPRKFYLDSMRSVENVTLPLLRIGFYDPASDCPPVLIGPIWTDSKKDKLAMKTMLRGLRELANLRNYRYSVGVFPL